MKVKFLPLLCFALASLAWGQDGPPLTTTELTLPIFSVNLAPATEANTGLVGNPGPQKIYYWMVSNFLLGASSPVGPFTVNNAPNTLSGSNYVTFMPVYPGGGIVSIDLLKTSTPSQPTGACNCAVATAVASGTINDQSNSTSSYTVAPVVVSDYTQTLTNEVQGAASTHLILRQNGVFVADLSTAATGGLPVGCSPGQIPTYNGTTWICTSGGTGTVTGPGTSGRIAEWNGTLSLGNAPISDSGSLLSVTEPLSFSAGNAAGTSLTSAATATSCSGSATFFNTTSTGCRNASFLINPPSSATGTVSGLLGLYSDPVGGTSGSFAAAGVYGVAQTSNNSTVPNFLAGVAGFATNTFGIGSPGYLAGLSGIAYESGAQTPGHVLGVYAQAGNQTSSTTLPFGAAFYAAAPITTSPFTLLYGYYQVGSEPNLFHGTLTTTGFIDSTITPGTNPLCPNGTGGAFTNIGCSGGGGGMVWPSTAGIPYWTSGTAWGGAYNSSTTIPANYIPTLNQSTTGNAATATNISTSGTANQVWGMNSGATAQGWQSIGSTGLTSVGLSTTASWLTVGASPLTSNGTITLNPTTAQTQNEFVATPNGSAGAVGLRAIVAADVPTLNQSTTGNAATATTASNATNVATTGGSSSSSTFYPTFVSSNTSGNYGETTTSGLNFVPSTGVLSATGFAGAGTGLTGTATSLNVGGNAATATNISTSGTANQVWGMNSGGSAQGWQTVSGGGSGTVNNATQYSAAYYSASGSANTISGLAAPTSPNGVPQTLVSIPSGGVATAPQIALPGVPIRVATGASDTILSTDCNPYRVEYTTHSGAVAVTLPTATSLGVPGCSFKIAVPKTYYNGSSWVSNPVTKVTVTPTTWTVNGKATISLYPGQTSVFFVDTSVATNWAEDHSIGGGTIILGDTGVSTGGVSFYGATSTPSPAPAITVNATATNFLLNTNVLPTTTGTFSLGSAAAQWSQLNLLQPASTSQDVIDGDCTSNAGNTGFLINLTGVPPAPITAFSVDCLTGNTVIAGDAAIAGGETVAGATGIAATGGPVSSGTQGALQTTVLNGVTGAWGCVEGSTAGTPTAGYDYLRCDSTSHTILYSHNGSTEAALGAASLAFPLTISGTANSGGVPYFNSTTQLSSSAALANGAIVQGGGAGAAPATGNGDFTIDNTAHTLLSGASGLVDFSAITGANGFKMPVKAGLTVSANGGTGFDSTNKMEHNYTNGVDSKVMTVAASATITNSDCVKFAVASSVITLADAGAACGSGGGGSGAGGAGSNGTGIVLSGTSYAPLFGPYASIISTDTSAAQTVGPAAAVQSLYVDLGTAIGAGQTLVVSLCDVTVSSSCASLQAVTCTVPNSGSTCNDTTHSYSAPAGDLLVWKMVLNTSTATSNVFVGAQIGTGIGTFSGNTSTAVSATGGVAGAAVGTPLVADGSGNAEPFQTPSTVGIGGVDSFGRPYGSVATTGSQGVLNTTYVHKYYNKFPQTVGNAVMSITTAGTATTMYACIYTSTSTAAVWSANAASTSVGVINMSAAQYTLLPNTVYYVATGQAGTTSAFYDTFYNALNSAKILNQNSTRVATAANNMASGCPATLGTLTAANGLAAQPVILLEP